MFRNCCTFVTHRARRRRETFYDAKSAKNKVEINLPVHALKGASFSWLWSDTKTPALKFFHRKQVRPRLDKNSSQSLTPRDHRHTPRAFLPGQRRSPPHPPTKLPAWPCAHQVFLPVRRGEVPRPGGIYPSSCFTG